MDRAMRALKELPPFSATLSRLMASLANDDVSLNELGDLVEKDTVVAGNILGMVNSALYARRSTVTSVRHALSLLGTNKIRNVALSLQVAGMWNQSKCPQELSIKRFNQHAAAVAMLSDLLTQHVDVVYPEGAFVAGLLHDVGRLTLALGLPQDFAQILEKHLQSGTPLVECEADHLHFTHATLSGQALTEWKLPDPIRVAVAGHHDPWVGPPSAIPLSPVVAAADRFINSVGLSTWSLADEPEPDFSSFEMLGIQPEKALELARTFQSEFEVTAQFYR